MMARIAHGLIPVRVLHTVSTGYAGFLGGLLHHSRGQSKKRIHICRKNDTSMGSRWKMLRLLLHHSRGLPLVLSEHGIYTHSGCSMMRTVQKKSTNDGSVQWRR